MKGISCDAAVLKKGHEKEKSKIKPAGEESPEEPAGFLGLAGKKAAGEAGDNIHSVDSHIYLAFRKTEFEKNKSQSGQKNAGDYVSDNQRAYHAPDFLANHEPAPFLIKSACLLNNIRMTLKLSLLQLGNWYGIMSPDIIPVHLVSAFTAESQALESAGGPMADSRPLKKRTNSLANRVHPAEYSMLETCYNVARHYT